MKSLPIIAAALLAGGTARGQDVAGSHDLPGFSRFAGADIIHFVTQKFAGYLLARGEGDFHMTSERAEGAATRILYRIPEGHSALEAFRNYEQMLTDLGLTRT